MSLMTKVTEEQRKSLPTPPTRRYTVTVTNQLPNGICEGLLAYETTVVKWAAMLSGYDRSRHAYTQRTDAPVHNIWVNADNDRELAAALLILHFKELHDSQWKAVEHLRKQEAAAHTPANNYGVSL
jgi:hypothetical protein